MEGSIEQALFDYEMNLQVVGKLFILERLQHGNDRVLNVLPAATAIESKMCPRT